MCKYSPMAFLHMSGRVKQVWEMAFGKQTDCCDLKGMNCNLGAMSCLDYVSHKGEANEICAEAVS